MGAYANIVRLFNDIIDTAIKLGYSQENICILSGDLSTLRDKFPCCYSNLMSCSHAMDSRSAIEYGRDLVANWMLEDTIVRNLQDSGLQIYLSGGDKNRKLLSKFKVSSNSDCKVNVNGCERSLEIVTNFTNYWEKNLKIDLRDSKYDKLIKEKSLLLGLLFKTKKYFLLDFSNPNFEVVHIDSHQPWGGKPANSIVLNKSMFQEYNNSLDIVNKIKEIV